MSLRFLVGPEPSNNLMILPATNPDDAFVYSQLKTISLGTPGIAAFYTHTSISSEYGMSA